MTTTTDRPAEQADDTTRGDQVLAAFAGLLLVVCALVWMALMLWFTLAGR